MIRNVAITDDPRDLCSWPDCGILLYETGRRASTEPFGVAFLWTGPGDLRYIHWLRVSDLTRRYRSLGARLWEVLSPHITFEDQSIKRDLNREYFGPWK